MELNYASKGVANAGLATGIVGTALSVINGGGALLGMSGWGRTNEGCGKNAYVTRYEMEQENIIAQKDSEIALLRANTYNDQKSIEMYKYIDGKFATLEAEICAQKVQNQAMKDSIQLVDERRVTGETALHDAIKREADARKCNDNTIVNYANATFYPKQVADVTVGTTTVAQTVYNPLPVCNCNC